MRNEIGRRHGRDVRADNEDGSGCGLFQKKEDDAVKVLLYN